MHYRPDSSRREATSCKPSLHSGCPRPAPTACGRIKGAEAPAPPARPRTCLLQASSTGVRRRASAGWLSTSYSCLQAQAGSRQISWQVGVRGSTRYDFRWTRKPLPCSTRLHNKETKPPLQTQKTHRRLLPITKPSHPCSLGGLRLAGHEVDRVNHKHQSRCTVGVALHGAPHTWVPRHIHQRDGAGAGVGGLRVRGLLSRSRDAAQATGLGVWPKKQGRGRLRRAERSRMAAGAHQGVSCPSTN